MKKTGLMFLAVAIMSTMVLVNFSEAWEWGKYPTLDAWRLAGIRNGYDAGYADGYAGYTTYPRYNSPEYREAYHRGYQDGAYHCSRYGGHSNYGSYDSYGSYGSHPSFDFNYRNRGKGWSIRIPVPPAGRRY